MRASALVLLLAATPAAMLLGCSPGDGKGSVIGTVNLDGAPLKTGNVRFVPVDGGSATAGAAIVDGRFQAKVAPGNMRVEISAPKVVGKQRMINAPDAPEVDVVEELLPARYNVKSELMMEVHSGSQDRQFDLKSK